MQEKEKWVISLGGSRIAPEQDKIDVKFIKQFQSLISKHPSKKFVVVTGGGATARKYIKALRKLNKPVTTQSKAGIAVTRFHASFLSKIFRRKANSQKQVPKNMKKVSSLLKRNQVVFTGALRWEKTKTSDGTAADLAADLKTPFINITNVPGLYTSNPKTNKKAKLIKKISWKNFNKLANKTKFKAGQHFVLDQDAATTIMKKKIPTYIVGSLGDVNKILNKKSFKGTLISG